MPRRVSLPGASELFRPTDNPTPSPPEPPSSSPELVEGSSPPEPPRSPPEPPPSSPELVEGPRARGTGRVRHDEKITVYVSNDELVALEQARLTMRARHGLAVDRGRIVREAISAAIADLEAHGADSELIRRLSPS